MKCSAFLSTVIAALSFNVSQANASSVAIDSLFVNSASVSLAVNNRNLFSRTMHLSAAEITMGEYQSSIVEFGTGWGSSTNIYTTGSFGAPAPSGYVEGATINVDLSSIRLAFDSWLLDFDMGLWPMNTPHENGVYDPLTGQYRLGWHYDFFVDRPGTRHDLHGVFSVQLDGNLTTSAVPVPAALWLFGSGLMMLVGVVRHRVSKL